ncbi:MAG TPA: sugar phosphate nucleotidyltransferase, partial [Verrucomicrobiae bacterium]|nr:sugar phosphate nucleotidyltransferase [Verrucomicrobiae bacterium]
MFVCLAAGRGTRMQPLTNYLHKAMIPFFGVPLLAYGILAVP